MAFWNQGVSRDEPDDFDKYDPTPYGGGYDIALTYGRPVPQSEETCYPLSTFSSSRIDYDPPSYSSGSRPSPYEPVPEPESDHDRYGHQSSFHPKPLPAYGFHLQGEEIQPKPDNYSDYGSVYSQPKPQYGSGYGCGGEYGSEYPHPKPQLGGGCDSQYAFGYSHPKPQHGSDYCGGGDNNNGSEYSWPKPQFGSGYGRGEESEYGSVYPPLKSRFESGYGGGGSEYGSDYSQPKPQPQPHYGSGYGGGESEFGSGFGMRPGRKEHSFREEGVEEYDEHGRRNKKIEGYGYNGSGYKKPGYGEEEEGRYGGGITNCEAPSYGGVEEDSYQKPSHYGGIYEVEEYNPQKFGNDEEKKRHHHRHHHHHNYADE